MPGPNGQAYFTAQLNPREPRHLLQRAEAGAEAGLIAGGGIGVERALLDGLVDGRDRLPEHLLRGRLVALGERVAEMPQRGADTGSVDAIAHRALRGLPGALERGEMIRHNLLGVL